MCDFIIIIIYYKIFELINIKENYQYKNITKFTITITVFNYNHIGKITATKLPEAYKKIKF
jgi:hypothetical protein